MIVRCNNCKGEFESPTLACAKCGLDPAKNPRDAEWLVKLEVIHFDPPTNVAGRGKNHAACDPKLTLGGNRRFTGEPVAVTCAKCKASDVYKAANGEANGTIDIIAVPK